MLIQVNVAGEEGKAGIAPEALGDFIARCPVPGYRPDDDAPFVERAEDSRRHFARLAELAAEHELSRLSMGTTQDYEVAAQEGATIVRLGARAVGLYPHGKRPAPRAAALPLFGGSTPPARRSPRSCSTARPLPGKR